MNLASSGFQHNFSESTDLYLEGDEVVVLVDDDAFIRTPIKIYFEEKGLRVLEADSGAAFQDILRHQRVALALLDIGLPDSNGLEILPHIKKESPDTAVLMLSGVADLNTALNCIRAGADDYMAKPAKLDDIYLTTIKILEKRRLIIENHQYQEDLEKANFRIQLMHQLSLKMNNAYLNTVELREILQAVLVGITANEGLRFNRAFLAMFDEKRRFLRGTTAIGPSCREEAAVVWHDLREKNLDFLDIIKELKGCSQEDDVNRMIRSLEVPVDAQDHILIRSALDRKSFRVTAGYITGVDPTQVSEFLGTDTFVVVPLYSPRRPLGVIIADNFVTGHPISDSYLSALELFSCQASLAIEHSRLYSDMQKSIAKLKSANHELAKNKDMLVEAERYAALGHMASQLVHNIRNPITSISGMSRIIAKKAEGLDLDSYVTVMEREAKRLEDVLRDTFDFVSHTVLHKELTPLLPLVEKSLLLFEPDISAQKITTHIENEDPELQIKADKKLIRKMLVHLLRNAVEAMPQGGDLRLEISKSNNVVRLTITNTGKSISSEQLKRAKEPFFTTKSHGTGMGLAMVDHIIKGHGGTFTLESTANGTEVIVFLPQER